MTTILVLLQIAFSLLANPKVQSNPAMVSEINSIVNAAIQIEMETPTSTPIVPIVIPTQPIITNPTTTQVVVTPPITQLLGTSEPTVVNDTPPFNFVPGITQTQITSSSVSIYVNTRNTSFDSIQVTLRCTFLPTDSRYHDDRYNDCVTPSQTTDIVQNTDPSNPFTFTGLASDTEYSFDEVASKDAFAKSQSDDFDFITSSD